MCEMGSERAEAAGRRIAVEGIRRFDDPGAILQLRVHAAGGGDGGADAQRGQPVGRGDSL